MTELTERVARLEGAYDHLATKADIAELKVATQADIAELKAATQADIAALKAATHADIQALNDDLTQKIGPVEKEVAGLKSGAKTLATAVSVGLVAVQLILKYALP